KPAASAETPANGRRRSLRQSAVGAGRSCSGGPRAGGGLKRRRAISGKPSSPPSYPFFRRRFRCDWFLCKSNPWEEKKKRKRNKVGFFSITPITYPPDNSSPPAAAAATLHHYRRLLITPSSPAVLHQASNLQSASFLFFLRLDLAQVSPLPATPHGSGFRSLFSIHYRIHFLKANFWFLTKGT
uniref:Uncharacterized protein n=1 Tax=Oryza nivara TaxID=4536 RepID=A0A0E0IX17_ORYNI